MTVIDTHVHLVSDPGWVTSERMRDFQRTFTLEDFSEAAGTAIPEAIITVPSVPAVDETERMLRTAADAPLIGAVIGWVDLASPDVAETLDRLSAQSGGERLRGVRHPVQTLDGSDWLLRDDVARGFTALAERDLCFEILVRADQIAAATTAVSAHPRLRFILNHGGNPLLGTGQFDEWEADVRTLSRHPQVTVKISGQLLHHDTTTVPEKYAQNCVNTLLDAFGTDRLMFGSNYPFCLTVGGHSEVLRRTKALFAELPSDVVDHILGRNAVAVYRLDSASSGLG